MYWFDIEVLVRELSTAAFRQYFFFFFCVNMNFESDFHLDIREKERQHVRVLCIRAQIMMH